MTQKDDRHEDQDSSLDAAKKKLSEIHGRPFDVDKILAERRAREERERIAGKKVKEKLEREHALARERGHEIRAREVERGNETLEERRLKLDAAKRQFEKRREEKKLDNKS